LPEPRHPTSPDEELLEAESYAIYSEFTDAQRLLRIQDELRAGFAQLSHIGKAVSFVGSARTPRDHPRYAAARALARRLGEDGTALAAKLPVLRPAVCAELIRAFSKRNALVSAAIFVPGVDMPVLTLNQVRLVARIALAYGQQMDSQRTIELMGVVGAGFGFRAVARELLDFVPVAGWAVKGAIAYAGTKAVGEAAVRYFEART